ncbi:MAG: carboxymuconolactone decarboxylase family protein [Vicinamibacterales bacterium]
MTIKFFCPEVERSFHTNLPIAQKEFVVMSYPVLSETTAPEAARATLTAARRAYGFVPNLFGVMAQAPALVKAYVALNELFAETSLSPTERQVVLLATSATNKCAYCMAAHTAIAGMQRVPAPVIDALRAGTPIADPQLEALRQFTAAVVETRGWPTATQTALFTQAGYTAAQALEVVLGVGLKTISNYTNHFAETPLDDAFAPAAWTPTV